MVTEGKEFRSLYTSLGIKMDHTQGTTNAQQISEKSLQDKRSSEIQG